MNPDLTLYCADAAADDRGVLAAPAGLLVRTGPGPAAEIVEVGPLGQVEANHESRGARRIEFEGGLILPAFVNAHAHLDLTAIGPRPYDPSTGFAGWIGEIRQRRAVNENEISDSVRMGVEKSLAGGVVAVGDIAGAGSLTPMRIMRDSGMRGVSFFECFGLGSASETIARLNAIFEEAPRNDRGVRLGLQPHAPYSAGRGLVRHCMDLSARTGTPLCMHVAESRDEHECVVESRGAIRAFLESLGIWNDGVAAEFGAASTPVQHMREALKAAPWLVVHVNECTDEDLETLAGAGTSVAYCPRASAYFAHERDFGPHRYQDMLARGVNVALGTDSIVCLPESEAGRLSTFDEMRFLFRRDGVDPTLLLRMATTNGAAALGLSPDEFRLTPGRTAGLVVVSAGRSRGNDFLSGALIANGVPRLLTGSTHSC